MSVVLLTVRLPHGADLKSAMRHLELTEDEVDAGYGLVPIDPARNLYALRVTEEAGRRVTGGGSAEGPYSDPPIEPYGRPG